MGSSSRLREAQPINRSHVTIMWAPCDIVGPINGLQEQSIRGDSRFPFNQGHKPALSWTP